MKQRTFALLAALALAVPGTALADPPDSDPTDGAGSAGEAGCQGINEARDHTSEEADAGLDLVESILASESDGECPEGEPGSDNGSGSAENGSGNAP